MILADTSVWIDHLRGSDHVLSVHLERREVLAHPFVVGELALGNLRNRDAIIADLRSLPQAVSASDEEVLGLVGQSRLFGLGIRWVDAHLIASVLLTPGARLMTRDRRLATVATSLSIAA